MPADLNIEKDAARQRSDGVMVPLKAKLELFIVLKE